MNAYLPKCRALLIGSVPVKNHREAVRLVFSYTPEIPLWPQLPVYHEEGMILQFVPGMPGIKQTKDSVYIDTEAAGFETQMAEFYEDYLTASENDRFLESSRFALTEQTAKGFFIFLNMIRESEHLPRCVKGQVTGPITMGIALQDQDKRSIFYNDNLRDMLTRHIAMKAKWQVNQLKKLGTVDAPIIFFDEPGIVSFGSSAYIGISREQVMNSMDTVISAVHDAGAIAGIHICANGDWSLALDSKADIISFDAYSYFDNFILFADSVKKFILSKRILAWGIVPTSNPDDIDNETVDSLRLRFDKNLEKVVSLGLDPLQILNQSFITPSCGTGSLSLQHAMKVLELTKNLSNKIQERIV